MSNQEQFEAIGRLVTDAAESKKRLALLQNEIVRASQAFGAAASALTDFLQDPSRSRVDVTVQQIIPVDKVFLLCEEFAKERIRSGDLQSKIKSLGI